MKRNVCNQIKRAYKELKNTEDDINIYIAFYNLEDELVKMKQLHEISEIVYKLKSREYILYKNTCYGVLIKVFMEDNERKDLLGILYNLTSE